MCSRRFNVCVYIHGHTSSQLSPVFLTRSNTCAQPINTRPCLTSRFVCLQAGSQRASGRSCDRPTPTRFSSVFLGPTANWSVGTQNPHCSPPQNTALPTLSALCPNTKPAPLPPSSTCCTSQHSTSQHCTFVTYQRFTLPPAYLYQKDERALPLKLQISEQQTFLFPLVIIIIIILILIIIIIYFVPLTMRCLPVSFLSLSLDIKGINLLRVRRELQRFAYRLCICLLPSVCSALLQDALAFLSTE